MYYVYILKSKNFSRYYIGNTNDLKRRLAEHNTRRARSTKAYVPWEVIYVEKFFTKSEAVFREMEIKSYKSGFKFKELIQMERWQSG